MKINPIALNSLTKYPSIPTYHALGKHRTLLPETIDFGGEPLYASEKIDGTNTRIILLPKRKYVVGSREELLYAKGDFLFDNTLDIVDAAKDLAERLLEQWCKAVDKVEDVTKKSCKFLKVYYLETYGGRMPESMNYTGSRKVGHQLFDICNIDIGNLEMRIESMSGWRERGGQAYFSHTMLVNEAARLELPLAPRIVIDAIPTDIKETYDWMSGVIPTSLAALDAEANQRPEGLVVRNHSRSKIAKLRFQDYETHFRKAESLKVAGIHDELEDLHKKLDNAIEAGSDELVDKLVSELTQKPPKPQKPKTVLLRESSDKPIKE